MKMHILKIIDDLIIIPGAMGNLLIGIVYGVWTQFGFFFKNPAIYSLKFRIISYF